jgi:hypothetical protein
MDVSNFIHYEFTVPAWLLVLTIAGGAVIRQILLPGNRNKKETKSFASPATAGIDNSTTNSNSDKPDKKEGRVDNGNHSFKQPVNIDVDYDVKNDYTLLDGTSKLVLCVNMSLNMGKVSLMW